MAIEGTGEGFFTKEGVLKTSTTQTSKASESSGSVSEQVANNTSNAISTQAAAITEAAIVSITSRMGAAGTGYTIGVSRMVEEAVTSALKYKASSFTSKTSNSESSGSSSSTTRLSNGGTYQNEILASTNESSSGKASKSKGKSGFSNSNSIRKTA